MNQPHSRGGAWQSGWLVSAQRAREGRHREPHRGSRSQTLAKRSKAALFIAARDVPALIEAQGGPSGFVDSLPGHLPGDATSQERLPDLLSKLQRIAALAKA